MRSKDYPEVLSEIAHHLGTRLIDCGVGETKANEAAFEAVESVRRMYGGQLIYIPRGIKFDSSERDREIYRKYLGNNIPELASEYQLSAAAIYRIVARVRAKSKASGTTKQP